MTLEALLVHYLDILDSKFSAFAQILAETPPSDGCWSRFHPQLGPKTLPR